MLAVQPIKPAPRGSDTSLVDRSAAAAGALTSLPFTLSVALLCTTSGDDRLYSALSVVTMLAVFGGVMALQVARGARAFRGAPLARPLASVTTSYMTAVFAIMLTGDAAVRVVKPGFLPAGPVRAAVLWIEVLAPMAAVPALTAFVVAAGVGAARAHLSSR